MKYIVLLTLIVTLVVDFLIYTKVIRRLGSGQWLKMSYLLSAIGSIGLCVGCSLMAILVDDNTTFVMSILSWGLLVSLSLIVMRLVMAIFLPFRLYRTALLAVVATLAIIVWGVTIGRTTFVVNRVEVRSQRVPAAFDGLRIVHISDVHIGSLVRPEVELRRLVEGINALDADLVVCSGDLVNIRHTELDDQVMEILAGVKSRYGVLSNIGNHDTGGYVKNQSNLSIEENLRLLIEKQHRMGWRVIDNTTEIFKIGGDSITISGISFDPARHLFRHSKDFDTENLAKIYQGVDRDMYNITISHIPQLWDDIREFGFGDLTLSGHVHGMQMKVRIGDKYYSPAQLIYNEWSGRYDIDGRTLYINDGIGAVGVPMRLGAYPEITLLILKR